MPSPVNNNQIPYIPDLGRSSIGSSSSSESPASALPVQPSFSAQTVLGKGRNSINGFFSPKKVKHELDDKSPINKRDQVGPRPSLLSPSSLVDDDIVDDELSDEQWTVALYKEQFRLNRQESSISTSLITTDSKVNDALMKQFLNLQEESQKRSKLSKIFSWMSLSTTVMVTAVLAATVAAAALGAVSVAAVLTAVGGAAAFFGGKQKIISSVFAHLGNQSMGKSLGVKEQSRLTKDSIAGKLDQMQSHESSNPELCTEFSQIIKSQPKINL